MSFAFPHILIQYTVYKIWINKGIIKISYGVFYFLMVGKMNDNNRFGDFFNVDI